MTVSAEAVPGETPGTLEEPQVQAMFDRIAGIYDVLNQVMTVGLHHRWRTRAVELAQIGPGARVLDVATGTGDLAFTLAQQATATGAVIATDFSEKMLEIARTKAGTPAAPRSASSSPTRSRCRSPTTSSTPRRSPSACATSPTCSRGCASWRGS
jgi:hypothetical protein